MSTLTVVPAESFWPAWVALVSTPASWFRSMNRGGRYTVFWGAVRTPGQASYSMNTPWSASPTWRRCGSPAALLRHLTSPSGRTHGRTGRPRLALLTIDFVRPGSGVHDPSGLWSPGAAPSSTVEQRTLNLEVGRFDSPGAHLRVQRHRGSASQSSGHFFEVRPCELDARRRACQIRVNPGVGPGDGPRCSRNGVTTMRIIPNTITPT